MFWLRGLKGKLAWRGRGLDVSIVVMVEIRGFAHQTFRSENQRCHLWHSVKKRCWLGFKMVLIVLCTVDGRKMIREKVHRRNEDWFKSFYWLSMSQNRIGMTVVNRLHDWLSSENIAILLDHPRILGGGPNALSTKGTNVDSDCSVNTGCSNVSECRFIVFIN